MRSEHTTIEAGSPATSSGHEAQQRELLVVRCQLGEAKAFQELVELWHTPLWRYLRSMTSDSGVAEEVLQDAWLRILRGIGRLREPDRLRSWLFSIARRAFIDRLRRSYAEKVLEPLEEVDVVDAAEGETVSDDPVAHTLAREEVEFLRAALDRLAPPDREAMILFYLQELSLREVAEVLQVPEGTVKSRLHRGRRLLRHRLRAKGVVR